MESTENIEHLSDMDRIHRAIAVKFSNHRYKLFNTYVFGWESDYFSVTVDGRYMYEVEVKLSRSDFFADFQKSDKHLSLSNAFNFKIENEVHNKTPNRMYYCCPDGMIKKEEVPAYAGLLYLDKELNTVRQVKPAPFIHKENNSDKYLRKLVDKFYFQFIKMKSEYSYAKYRLQNHEKIAAENFKLKQMVDIEKNIGYIEEIERLKKELSKQSEKYYKDIRQKDLDNIKFHKSYRELQNEVEKLRKQVAEKETQNQQTNATQS